MNAVSSSESFNLIRSANWFPGEFEDSKFISEQSGIPQDVIEKKMGRRDICENEYSLE